ncbi:histidine kinase [Actinoplanes philippinensis]|uniref:histidine kinase n=1 Tax=Actinoplanes philippinensis TaxID=35752 RepID=A0A1I2LGY7_9ACTN|nr:sensor histidine kinase [Actinoplanes philippinensis]GIE80619.1 histidine kinase [Actinoplanes philippinensis]SFF76391.1 Signal transduction histidine kinase [Actinoplanes philippinensis]
MPQENWRRLRAAVDALERIVGGLGTALLALGALVWTAVVVLLCPVGIGVPLVPTVFRVARAVADRERARLTRWGPPVVDPPPLPAGVRDALHAPDVRRDMAWLAWHGTAGFLLGAIGISLPVYAVEDVTFPLWFWAIDPEMGAPGMIWWRVDGLAGALGVAVVGVGFGAVAVALGPGIARLQAMPGRRLLPPSGDIDLSRRVAELTATRAAALDAHAAELRRIERSLHDGTQNRLVALNVLIGAARRAQARNPDAVADILDRAQEATEQALAELRTVVRGILPPVLDDRGLIGALAGLAGTCAVPCEIDVDVPGRCAVSVEATAYFVVAESLTNVVKHSGATSVRVTVRRAGDRLHLRITDDGKGGADESGGSGLGGIRRRVEAYDGRFLISSPPAGPTTLDVELPCGS